MKKTIIAICSLAVLLVSCTKDFVTVKHNSSEPLDQYFINQSRAYEALVAAYDPLQWFNYFYQYTPLWLVSDIMADDVYCGGSNEGDQPVLVKAHYYQATPTDVCDRIWTVAYSGVNRACHVLERVDAVPGMSDADKNLYKAEATVLKAYYYNVLWKFWGNVPYYDVNLEAPYTAPQLNADQVYENIVSKIEEAVAMNVLPMKAAAGSQGRVTKAMAYMLYAEAVMYQNDTKRYKQAYDWMVEIINSGEYSLVDDFAGIWAESGEWCAESIWEVNFTPKGQGRNWDNPIFTGGTVAPVFIGIPTAIPGKFVEGWGFGPIAAHAYEMYAEGDIRRDGGIYNHLAEDPAYITENKGRWQSTGYFNLKYMAREGGNTGYIGDPNLNFGNNDRVYRFAECLLNAAELSLTVGGEGAAYLNMVRARAKCTDTGADLDAIIKERRKEFLGEGKRYWDLVRTGKAETVLTSAAHAYRPESWTQNKKYWPIPQSERDKDPNIVQNNY